MVVITFAILFHYFRGGLNATINIEATDGIRFGDEDTQYFCISFSYFKNSYESLHHWFVTTEQGGEGRAGEEAIAKMIHITTKMAGRCLICNVDHLYYTNFQLSAAYRNISL